MAAGRRVTGRSNTQFVADIQRQLERGRTVLSPSEQRAVRQYASRVARQGGSGHLSLAAKVLWGLQESYLDETAERGRLFGYTLARSTVPLADTLRGPRLKIMDPPYADWFKQAAGRTGNRTGGQTQCRRCEFQPKSDEVDLPLQFHTLAYYWKTLQKRMGISRVVQYPLAENAVTLLSPSLLLAAPRLQREDPVGIAPVVALPRKGNLHDQVVRRHFAEGVVPVEFSLERVGDEHPYLVALGDLNTVFRQNFFGPEMLQLQVGLYDSMDRVTQGPRPHASASASAAWRAQLFTMGSAVLFGPRSLKGYPGEPFRDIWNHAYEAADSYPVSAELSRRMEAQLQRDFGSHPRGPEIIKAFRTEFPRFNESEGGEVTKG